MKIGEVTIPDILTFRERQIYKLKLKDLSYRKIGEHFRVSGERIRQIEANILRKLRKHDSLDPFDRISTRLKNALLSNGIKNIEEAQKKTDYELLSMRCFGKICLNELRNL